MKSASGDILMLALSFAVLQLTFGAPTSSSSVGPLLLPPTPPSNGGLKPGSLLSSFNGTSPFNGTIDPLVAIANMDKFWQDYFQSLIGGKPCCGKPKPTVSPSPGGSTQKPNPDVPTTTAAPEIIEPIASPTEVDSNSGTCGKPSVPPSATPNTRIVNGIAVPGQKFEIRARAAAMKQSCKLANQKINRQWVATASHCVDGNTEAKIKGNTKIYVGTTNLVTATVAKGNIQSISRVIMHPEYNSKSMNNDIALIKLATPIATFTDTLMPACLPTEPITAKAVQTGTKGRRICYTTGWGRLGEKQPSVGTIGSGTDLLQQTAIEMFSVEDCQAGLKGLAFTDKMICGGFDGGKFDSCQGDSGGPMVCDSGNGVWTLNGVVSFGVGCARAGNPGVYANVYTLVPWINQTIAKN